jgi:hypothetical protein
MDCMSDATLGDALENVDGTIEKSLEAAAQEFMARVYVRISHGDEPHRAWLADACSAMEEELTQALEAGCHARVL